MSLLRTACLHACTHAQDGQVFAQDTPVSQPRRAIVRGRGHIGYLAGITPDDDRPSK